MLESIIYNESIATLSMQNMLICSLVSVILGIIIAVAYMITSDRYTKNFAITLALLPILVQVVIMLVNGNLGTGVAILGAFSLVRFRSVPGNSKEIAAVFWAMATGLATGTGYIGFAALFVIIVAIFFFVLSKTGFGDKKDLKKRLKVIIPENLDYTSIFDDIFARFVTEHSLVKVKTTNLGSMIELVYEIQLMDETKEKAFIDEIRTRNGNLTVLIERKGNNTEEL